MLIEKLKDKIVLIQYIAFTLVLFVVIAGNLDNRYLWLMALCGATLFISFLFRNLYIYKTLKFGRIVGILALSDIIIAFLIIRLDSDLASTAFFYIVVSDLIINRSVIAGLVSSIFCFLLYVIDLRVRLYNVDALTLVSKAFKGLILFIVILVFLYIIKYILKQNEIIEGTLNKLSAKTLEQEMTFNELKEAYDKLEDITILKERNRIAREIHDTLGHTLTTVLVETEAGKILVKKNNELGMQKFELAQEQLRKGLKDLRFSVRMLEKGEELIDFKSSLEQLLKNSARHAGVNIRYDIDILMELKNPIRKAVYRALQEGITNGIKHGKSTAFVFKLKTNNNSLEFLLQDNGKGCSAVIPGFGLKTMQERIKDVGGRMNIESEIDEGFSLSICIPIRNEGVEN